MKQREKGEVFRPAAKVEKVRGKTVTVMIIGGKRYVLEHLRK